MEDARIIELYWQRNQDAVTETDRKYSAYCHAIANRILQSPEDAEECVNDTWLRAWNSIPPGRPAVLQMFLAKIVRNIAFNRWNAQNAKKRGGSETGLVLDELSECIAGSSDVESEIEVKELSECIRLFVRTLPERDGNVFVRRYFFNERIPEIGKRYGLTENHVTVILSRTRKKLKTVLIREGYINEKQ